MKNIEYGHSVKTTVFVDVPEGSNSWYKVDVNFNKMNGMSGIFEIHISSINEVNTARWNHGKFGKGQTSRIN